MRIILYYILSKQVKLSFSNRFFYNLLVCLLCLIFFSGEIFGQQGRNIHSNPKTQSFKSQFERLKKQFPPIELADTLYRISTHNDARYSIEYSDSLFTELFKLFDQFKSKQIKTGLTPWQLDSVQLIYTISKYEANFYSSRQKEEVVATICNHIVASAEKLGTDKFKAIAYSRKASLSQIRGDTVTAYTFAQKVFDLVVKNDYQTERLSSLKRSDLNFYFFIDEMLKTYRHMNKLDELERIVEKFLSKLKSKNLVTDEANFIRVLAGIYMLRNDRLKFMSLYKQSLKLLEDSNIKDNFLFGHAYMKGAELFIDMGNIHSAIVYYKKSYSYLMKVAKAVVEKDFSTITRINDATQMGTNLAFLYAVQGDIDSTYKYAKEVHDFLSNYPEVSKILTANWLYGYYYYTQKEYKESLKYFFNYLRLRNNFKISYESDLFVYSLIAGSYHGMGDIESEQIWYTKATTTLDTIFKKKDINFYRYFTRITAYEYLISAGLRFNDFRFLQKLVPDLIYYTRQLKTKQTDSDIIENLLLFDAERNEKTIQYLQAKNQLKESQSTIQRMYIYLLCFILIATIIVGITLYKQRKIAQKRNRRLVESNREIEAVNQKLSELDAFKKMTTAMLVHDLKNPLNGILYLSGKASYNTTSGQSEEEKMMQIHSAALQMAQLSSNMLDVYKFESAGVNLNKAPIHCGQLLMSAIEQIEIMAYRKNIRIKKELPNLFFEADHDLLTRTLINILNNAVKHTPFNGLIYVTAYSCRNKQEQSPIAEDSICINVEDTGPGVKDDMKTKIFQKFGQDIKVDEEFTTSVGLGLAFCQLVIEAHGGKIYVENSNLGGAKFVIEIPFDPTFNDALINIPSNIISFQNVNGEELPNNPTPVIPKLELTNEDLNYLNELIIALRKLEYYEYTDINHLIEEYQTQPDFNKLSDEGKEWLKKIKNATLHSDQLSYEELINSCITS